APPPTSTLVPYTTLFRSCSAPALRAWEGRALARPQSRGAELPAAPFRTGGGAPTQKSSHRGRCSCTEHIGEARAHRRSTRPGCRSEEHTSELQSRENLVC